MSDVIVVSRETGQGDSTLGSNVRYVPTPVGRDVTAVTVEPGEQPSADEIAAYRDRVRRQA